MRSKLDRSTSLLATGALVVALTACGGPEEQPELPPTGSMTTDLEAPSSAPAAAKNADPAGDSEYTHFASAWVRVKILEAHGAGIVLIPGAVMAAALSQEPALEAGTWVWSVTALGATADLEIRASAATGWDVNLYITTAQLDRFLWVEGDFSGDLTQGTWTMNDASLGDADNSVLAIHWSYTSDTDRSLTFENTNATSADVGDTLTYSVDANTATVVFEDASDAGLVANIAWDTRTAAGRIQVPGYNNGEVACWDETFVNAPCP